MPVFPTVDGRNPAPPGIYKNPVNNGIFIISTGAGFLPSTVVKDLQKMVDSPPCYICLPGMGKPCSVTRKILRVNDLHPTPTQKKTRKLKEKTKFKIPPPQKKKKNDFLLPRIYPYIYSGPPEFNPSPSLPSWTVRCTVPSKRLPFLLGKASTRKGVGQNSGRCFLLRLLLKNKVLHEKFRGHPTSPNLNVEAENNGFKKRTLSVSRHLFFRWTILNFLGDIFDEGFFFTAFREKKHHIKPSLKGRDFIPWWITNPITVTVTKKKVYPGLPPP